MVDEARLLPILRGALDRRDGSDELALAVDGPAARHHLSRLRANVVRPLRIGPGLRVLDVTGESGAIARHAAERGAQVVCLAGSAAAMAQARCEGLAGVTVLPVDIEEYDGEGPFDLVLSLGELPSSLPRLAGLTAEDGALVVGVDNPVGLRSLFGYDEEPCPRMTGRLSAPQVQAQLADAGLRAQRLLAAYPDHRLAMAVLDDRAYASTDFVDQLVRWPCRHDPASPLYVCDDRVAHRMLLDAGIGPQVANSSLLVCGRTSEAVDALVDPDAVAWIFSGDRRRLFLGWKIFRAGTVLGQRVEEGPATVRSGWLAQTRAATQERRVGRTVEQHALAACGEGAEAVGRVLRPWRDHLAGLECEPGDERHPYRTRRSTRFLPADHLDVNLPNFVVDFDGRLQYVDDEWRAPSPVDADLVRTRALWWFAVDLVHRGVAHPWGPSASVDELTGLLGECAAVEVDVAGMLAGEAAMQSQVSGLPYEHWQVALGVLGRASQTEQSIVRRLPFTSLRETVTELAAQVAELSWRLDDARDRNRDLVARSRADLEELRSAWAGRK